MGFGDRSDQPADQVFAVVLGELHARLTSDIPLPEVRDHLGGEQFVAAFGVLPARHVDVKDQERAEPSRLLDQTLDLCDRIFGGTDDRLTELAERVVAPLIDDSGRCICPGRVLAGLSIHVRSHRSDPPAHGALGLGSGLGDEHRIDHTPRRSVGAVAVFGRDLLVHIPVAIQCVEAAG